MIATHVGMRSANRDTQAYNLSVDTAQRIQQRDGLIGLILAQHQLGSTKDRSESRAALRRHLDAIAALGNGHNATAIGTDLDGFIKPTIQGLERASDMSVLESWIRQEYPDDAGAILHDKVQRLLRRAYEARA